MVADVLNLLELNGGDLCLVREIEAELSRSNEGASLVDMITEDLTECEVENVGASMVVPQRPTTELAIPIESIE